jgi:uncharacterized protein YgbK (DUF1537 family)
MQNVMDVTRESVGAMSGGRVLIVADDLTGACDSGVAFLASGRKVRVLLDAGEVRDADEVVVVTTESRNGTVEEAVERVSAAVELSLDGVLFKKVDSAARGHFGAEVLAALRRSRHRMALVAPAFPGAGRRVVDGTLWVEDIAGQARSVWLRQLFRGEDRVALLARGSKVELEDGIRGAAAAGLRILICDAVEQEDLDRLASAAVAADVRMLWAGSAGLARALASVLAPVAPRVSLETPRRDGRVLVFVGTDHPVTRLQVSHLKRGGGSHHAVGFGDEWRMRIREMVGGERLAGLVLTGGDSAAFVLRALGARAIRVGGEIATGIPWGAIEGGMADGCVVVTKSGGFGDEDALLRATAFCEGRAS